MWTFEICKDKYESFLIEKRRYFHMHPELSGKEFGTSRVIKQELDKMEISWRPCGMETGVLATVQGSLPGKTILLRGDMDALAVKETTSLPYASTVDGVMHACGHDCHTAMLLTAAKMLNDARDRLHGTVKFAFQPSEEDGQGARTMLDAGALDGVDGCFAIHVWGTVDAGKVSLEPGARMASSNKFTARIKGRGAHGAEPHNGVDAIVAAAAVIGSLQSVVSREIPPMSPAVLTVGTVSGGTGFNIIAQECEITGTTRCFDEAVCKQLGPRLERVITNAARAYGAEAEVDYRVLLPPVVNDDAFVALAREAAKKVLGGGCLSNDPATTAAEDFAFFARQVPGAMALLGIRNEACNAVWPNHSGNFCVDESQLLKGAMLYAQVAADHNFVCLTA